MTHVLFATFHKTVSFIAVSGFSPFISQLKLCSSCHHHVNGSTWARLVYYIDSNPCASDSLSTHPPFSIAREMRHNVLAARLPTSQPATTITGTAAAAASSHCGAGCGHMNGITLTVVAVGTTTTRRTRTQGPKCDGGGNISAACKHLAQSTVISFTAAWVRTQSDWGAALAQK